MLSTQGARYLKFQIDARGRMTKMKAAKQKKLTPKKKHIQKPVRKLAQNPGKLKMVSALTTQAKKRAEKLDKMLLKLAPGPYTQILKQIQTSKRRINEERQLALQLGERILAKAKEVRASIPLPRSRAPRG